MLDDEGPRRRVDASDDAVWADHAGREVGGDQRPRHQSASDLLEHVPHLQQAWLFGQDHVIGQQHRERLGSDSIAGDEHGVPEPLSVFLPHGDEVDHLGHRFHFAEEVRVQEDGVGEMERRDAPYAGGRNGAVIRACANSCHGRPLR